MIRKAFYMEVKLDCVEEYIRLHNLIPSELKAVLQRHGVHNYSIFHHEQSHALFGYMEVENEENLLKIAEYPCARAWWKLMTQYLVCQNPEDTKAKEEPMTQVFFME